MNAKLSKQEIIKWCEKYNKEEDQYNTGLEDELHDKLRNTKELTKEDLIKIVEWKFQGRLLGRRKRILNLIESIGDKDVKRISWEALDNQDEKQRIKKLMEIRGVGPALASVILTFYDPKNYGVYDIHAWRELFGREPKSLFSNINNLMQFFSKLREIANDYDLDARVVEKALFKKNYDESRNAKS